MGDRVKVHGEFSTYYDDESGTNKPVHHGIVCDEVVYGEDEAQFVELCNESGDEVYIIGVEMIAAKNIELISPPSTTIN